MEKIHAELKRKFDIYDRMKSRTVSTTNTARSEKEKHNPNKSKVVKDNYKSKLHCFSCGSSEHDVRSCSDKGKGPKCFKCNLFGHIAPKCPNKISGEASTKVSCVSAMDEMHVPVKGNNVLCTALIDTGSAFNLLRENIFRKLKSIQLQTASKVFYGLGRVAAGNCAAHRIL